MTSIRTILRVAVGGLASVLHVWYRGVLAVPDVKRRKAARRARRPY